jgi:tripartite-type tricarboxylate transporter receptor subunit TctC
MRQRCVLMFGLSALFAGTSCAAQTSYPQKPIRMVVGFPPGNSVDTVARLLGEKLGHALGKPVIIDNAAGAAGNIAADRVAKAAPDGYTLGLLSNAQLAINPSLDTVSYDPLKDFAAVSQVATSPYVLIVHNGVPARTAKELVALAKGNPGGLTFASGGGVTRVAGELFKSAAGVDIRHIPYKGVAAAIPDVVTGRVSMMFGGITILPLVREGKMRALAVTSSGRTSAAPDLPTIAESGYPGFEVTVWQGLMAPAKVPGTTIKILNAETLKALASPELRAKFADAGVEGTGSSPDAFAAMIRSEILKWSKVIKEAGIRPE